MWYYTHSIIWWYYSTIRNKYTLYNYCVIGKCTHGLHKRFDSCLTHGLHKRFDSCPTHRLRKRFDSNNLVLWFLCSSVFICRLRTISGLSLATVTSKLMAALKNLITLTFLATSTTLLMRISSTRKWWTRVTSSIEVDSDCCIIQSDIIWYYTILYHAVHAGSNYTEQYPCTMISFMIKFD